MIQWLALAAGALGGFGLVLVWSGWTTSPAPRDPTRQFDGFVLVRLAAGALAAAAIGLYTGWIVGTIAAGVAGFYAAGLARGGRRTTQHELARIEAVATWAEMLRDTLAAGQGLAETIQSTADIAPTEIRASVRTLAVRIERQRLSLALREWADEVDDPSADLVATVLIVAGSRSARDVGELLSALAATARERAAMRLRVDAQRAAIRSEVRSIIIVSLVFMVGLTVIAKRFVEPYATAGGQLMLLLVVTIFGAGLWWLTQLGKFTRPARFLARERVTT
jgi:tight adherence protein B